MDSDDEHQHQHDDDQHNHHYHNHQSGPYHSLDGLGAAGGGRSAFNLFNTQSSLPSQPAAYEDFAFDPPFETGLGSTMSSLFGFGNQSASSFSPPHSFSFGRPPPSLPLPPQPSTTAPGQHGVHGRQHTDDNTQGQSSSTLFDASETALFSSFLNTLDVDPNFLFNPVLPPGMPSPPPATEPVEVLQERDQRLGQSVGGLSLGQAAQVVAGTSETPQRRAARPSFSLDHGGIDRKPDTAARQAALYDAMDARHKQEAEPGDGNEKEGSHLKSDVQGGGTKRSASMAKRGGRRNQSSVGGQGDSTRGGKKARVAVPTPQTGSPTTLEHETAIDDDDDVDMKDAAGTHDPTATASTKGNQSRRRPSRVNTRRPSTTARAGPSSQPAQQSPTSSQSADVDAEGDPEVDEDENEDDGGEDGTSATASQKKRRANKAAASGLTETQKRSNHIQSEQKRRNAIKNGFRDLVDILAAGEAASGIIVAPPEEDDGATAPGGTKKKKAKGTGRGRGRRGEIGAGASKSVVLEKAAQYILWLERGNDGIDSEIERVEARLRECGIEV